MIDKIAALRKIADGGTTNNPPTSVKATRSYPPWITGEKMHPWMKRIVDSLPERRTTFAPPTSKEAPPWMRGKKALGIGERIAPGIWKNPDGSIFSDTLYRGGHNDRPL